MREYRLIRSKRKTIALHILPSGELVVRAPLHVSRTTVERVIAERENWITRHLENRPVPRPVPDAAQIAQWRVAAAEYIPPRAAHFAALMGVTPAKIKINAAAKRFGSCSSKGNLNFSCRLMAYPPEAIDYVVVHELAHLIHMNHSAAFYTAVAAVMPDYKARAAMLKR